MSSEENLVRIVVDEHELDVPESERELLEHMKGVLGPGGVVVDAGAYVGTHALFLSRACGARVLAFEPHPESCEVLRQNVAHHGASESVVVHPVALGASESRGVLLTASRTDLRDTRVEDGPEGPVPIVPLDAIDLPGPVAVMRIDVQGMELAVLSGARATIERDRPHLYVEVHSAAALAEVATLLAEWGYLPRAQFGSSPTVLFAPLVARSEDLAEDRVERAIRELRTAIARQHSELAVTLGVHERAIARTQAELFSLRGSVGGRARSLLEPAGAPSEQPRAQKVRSSWRRKLRKLRQTPRKFLTDASSPVLRTSGDLLDVITKRWRR